jgi:hypothetical protein
MNFQQLLSRVGVPILGIGLIAMAYRWYGWPGVVAVASGLVLWALLHFNRIMAVLKRAAERPIGYVDSAVMLNAKLRTGVTLMHVVALTRSLGALQTPKDTQPEVFRWTDASDSSVTCTFAGGKLTQWELQRPAGDQPSP